MGIKTKEIDVMNRSSRTKRKLTSEEVAVRRAERQADRLFEEMRQMSNSEIDESLIDWSAIDARAALNRNEELARLERINKILDRA